MPNHKKKYFVFTEIPAIELQTYLTSEEKMMKCDVLIILFDQENKAEGFLKEYGDLIPDIVPRILVKNKQEKPQKGSFYLSLSKSLKLDTSEYHDVPHISLK
mmetsp:Transcript_24616/g.21795  ORF Transcript_24616/g.21795 Transcript_24616/m.21795 type:complete len:102 (+) Transcript_24616:234-539(+)